MPPIAVPPEPTFAVRGPAIGKLKAPSPPIRAGPPPATDAESTATVRGFRRHRPLDRWVAHFPRTAGGIILAGALFVVADLGLLLFRIGG